MNGQDNGVLDYKIELLREGQQAQTAEIFRLAWEKADVGEHWTTDSAQQFVEHCFKKQPDLFYIAVHKTTGIIGGVAGEIQPWWDGFHLTETELFVHPEHQGKGVAQSLLITILENARRQYNITLFEGVADGKRHEFPLNWYKRIGIMPSGWIHISGRPEKILAELKKTTRTSREDARK